ncbi:unnamed protein product [Adineta ricciae]|uniref:fructose-bisphosphate aldolase n=2 Tax=Adineta ricciae TaxID=249248 RepID=A0A814G9Z0_ADIRI|nr:unnamed protein product [Adineta ricciae]
MSKYLQLIDLENTEENRRLYRQVLFRDAKNLSTYVSGVVFLHEALYQDDDNDKLFRDTLKENDILCGIRVDKGLVSLAGTRDEKTTQGLDGLGERCTQYYKEGVSFAKWRCALKVGDGLPSSLAIRETTQVAARYASICQQNRMVPIIELEVVVNGDDDLDRCEHVIEKILVAIYRALSEHHVFLEGTLLQLNMITAGVNCKKRYTPKDIAQTMIVVLRRTVPPAVPGVFFSSGNQLEEELLVSLNTINQIPDKKPWILTFSYGQAMQTSVLRIWAGKPGNIELARNQLLSSVKAYSAASNGEYKNDGKDIIDG